MSDMPEMRTWDSAVAVESLPLRVRARRRVDIGGRLERSRWLGIYKRGSDVAGAVAGLMVIWPVLLVAAVMVKLEDGGPVIYRQRRVSGGGGGREFWMFKLRTMRRDAESDGPAFAVEDDPRCTRVGRLLRRWSVDELPQFWNVLRGEMSLVGPRPERPEMMAKIERQVPGYGMRLAVRAGLTGWAQVHGLRGRTGFRRRLKYDLQYVERWSPMLDVRIVVRTVGVLVRGMLGR